MFITFEGVDGSGKTTQAQLLAAALSQGGDRTIRSIREPGGTPVAERIRTLVADPEIEPAPIAELLLFCAARADLVATVVRPALEAGEIVICDRFVDSTIAYQGAARGIAADTVSALNAIATGGTRPDVTFYLRIDPEEALPRAKSSDRFEGEGLALQQAVSRGYDAIASSEPGRVCVIDATASEPEVHEQILAELQRRGI